MGTRFRWTTSSNRPDSADCRTRVSHLVSSDWETETANWMQRARVMSLPGDEHAKAGNGGGAVYAGGAGDLCAAGDVGLAACTMEPVLPRRPDRHGASVRGSGAVAAGQPRLGAGSAVR